MKDIINKVYKIAGADEKFVWLFMYACMIFIVISHSFCLVFLTEARSFEIINIFPAYYLIHCMNKYREKERAKIYATIPITRQIVGKYEFERNIPRYILWSIVVCANNIVYMINENLYYGRGILGMLFVVSAIMLIISYFRENSTGDKEKVLAVICVICLIFLMIMYLVCVLSAMFKKADIVYGILNKIFGIFAGLPSIVTAPFIVVGILVHFYMIQSKKKGAWG